MTSAAREVCAKVGKIRGGSQLLRGKQEEVSQQLTLIFGIEQIEQAEGKVASAVTLHCILCRDNKE